MSWLLMRKIKKIVNELIGSVPVFKMTFYAKQHADKL